MTKVILNKDMVNLGEEGDICEVADGYARNFLIPQGIAVHCSKHAMEILNQRKNAIEKRKEQKRLEARSLKEKIEGEELTLERSVGEKGKLYGSITNATIVEELAKNGYQLDKRRVDVPDGAIKIVGEYTVKVKLYESETAELKVKVEGKEAE